MELYEAIYARRTIRDFEPAPIDDATIERIIGAGMRVPTNDHMRDWHFIVLRDKAVVRKLIDLIPIKVSQGEVNDILRDWELNDACQQDAYRDAIPKQYQMLADASCVVIPLYKKKVDLFHPVNLSTFNGLASIWCCIENTFLAATAEGYACTLRIPLGDEGEWARKVLGFPEDYLMPCFLAVGKPKADAKRVAQKDFPLAERIHWNLW